MIWASGLNMIVVLVWGSNGPREVDERLQVVRESSAAALQIQMRPLMDSKGERVPDTYTLQVRLAPGSTLELPAHQGSHRGVISSDFYHRRLKLNSRLLVSQRFWRTI